MAERRANARERGYTSAWDKARAGHLRSHPHCVMCAQQGRTTPATVVDHVKRHGGNQSLFWDKANWQSLCGPHHNSTKQRAEHRGFIAGCDLSGRPVDPSHPWNRRP